jgi:hypothetical protein
MFVQVIQAETNDPEAVRAALDRWFAEISPGASGWLGTTTGVTDDGRLITLARFDSEESARRSSDRPEQSAWWAETAKHLTDDVIIDESTKVVAEGSGDPDRAGFVQVMRGESRDPDRAFELVRQNGPLMARERPEILGRLIAQHDGGRYTMALYFTSEQEAREGERKPPPPEMMQSMRELNVLSGQPEFFDLREPWLQSPR